MKRFIYIGSFVVMLLVFGTMRLAAAADSTATVTIQTTSVAVGVGVQWGEGTLTYKGKKHSFSLQGLDLVGVGYAQVTARGTVSNITKLSDFEGVYVAAEAAASAGSGPAGRKKQRARGAGGLTRNIHVARRANTSGRSFARP